MSTISFKAKLFKIGSWTILRLPKYVSDQLPSRALTVVSETINGLPFKTVLEPDGRGSHWFRVDEEMLKEARVKAGDTVSVEIEPIKEWVEPVMPEDFKKALSASPKAKDLWQGITPNARWDWIRWIRAVKAPKTRQKHIEIALSKLSKGIRRPCCFNRNLCSEPYVSKNWVLLEPMQTT